MTQGILINKFNYYFVIGIFPNLSVIGTVAHVKVTVRVFVAKTVDPQKVSCFSEAVVVTSFDETVAVMHVTDQLDNGVMVQGQQGNIL
jgi:hypothetical protein